VSQVEIARARLLELAPSGFEELHADVDVELAVYGDAATDEAMRAEFGTVVSEPVDLDWEDRWRSFHRPVRVGGLWIGPPWERPPPGEPTVVIDPGRAFGTGAHPTTRASIELLAAAEWGSVLDAGCGSGVVAIAAARLGFARVVALDLDPVAIESARENARRNGVDVDVREADVLVNELPCADLVVANLDLTLVEALLGRLPPCKAIASGYLAHDVPRAPGWRRVDRLELEGWATDVFVRTSS
jgi:ribosomal protein L11 methyltransferase